MRKILAWFLLSLPALADVGTNQQALSEALTSAKFHEANSCGDQLGSVKVERKDENNFLVWFTYTQQQLGLKGPQDSPCNVSVMVKATQSKVGCLYEVTSAVMLRPMASTRPMGEKPRGESVKRSRAH